jgi:hypothetical protein
LWSGLISTALGSTENNSFLADEGVFVARSHLFIIGFTENTFYFADEGVVVVRAHLYIIGLTENTFYTVFCRRGSCCGQGSSLHHWLTRE